jgi:hypothetical protein
MESLAFETELYWNLENKVQRVLGYPSTVSGRETTRKVSHGEGVVMMGPAEF